MKSVGFHFNSGNRRADRVKCIENERGFWICASSTGPLPWAGGGVGLKTPHDVFI